MLKHKNDKKDGGLKIYIEGCSPKIFTPQMLEKMDEHYKFTKNYSQLFSTSGIFHIENNKIIKLVPNDKPSRRVMFDEETALLLDESYFQEENVLSQIPMHESYKQILQFNYCIGDDSKLYLIVEGVYDATLVNMNYKKRDCKGKQKYSGFIPENFYFLAKEEIENYLIKKELNVFLSLLN